MEVIEEWRDVPGYSGIKASNLGRVIGKLGEEVGCHTGRYVTCGGKWLPNSKGTTVSRARLILLTFVGPPPLDKPEADHINLNKHDDRLANLRWTDRYSQMQNRNVLKHSGSGIKGLYLLKATLPNHSDRWRCTVTVNHKDFVQHFKLDKKQEAIEWLIAKRLELQI